MRPGSTLLAVVLLFSAAASLTLAAVSMERSAIQAARNRMELRGSSWAAEDCAARAISLLDAPFAAGAPTVAGRTPPVPDSLPSLLSGSGLVAECPGKVELRPAGSALPVNLVGRAELRSLLGFVGLGDAPSDSLADALTDWRDADDVTRPLGCERACAARSGVDAPRNGRIAHIDELASVRGYTRADSVTFARTGIRLSALLSVEDDRVSVRHAPPAVLAALPGIGVRGAVAIVRRRRLGGWHPGSLQEIGALLDRSDADSLLQASTALGRLATVEPSHWILHVIAPRRDVGLSESRNETRLVLRLRLGADGVSVVNRMSGP